MEQRNCLRETFEMRFQKFKLGKVIFWTAIVTVTVHTVVLPLVTGAPADPKSHGRKTPAPSTLSTNATKYKIPYKINREEMSVKLSKSEKKFPAGQLENQTEPATPGWRVPHRKRKQQRRRHQATKTGKLRMDLNHNNNKSCCKTVKKENKSDELVTSEYLFQENDTFSVLNINSLSTDSSNESFSQKPKVDLNETFELNYGDSNTSEITLPMLISSDINTFQNKTDSTFIESLIHGNNRSMKGKINKEFKKIESNIFERETETKSDVFIMEANVEVPESWNQQQFLLQRMNPDLEITIEFLHENNHSADFSGFSNVEPSSGNHDSSDSSIPPTWLHPTSTLSNATNLLSPKTQKVFTSGVKPRIVMNSTTLPSIVKNFWGDKILRMNEATKNAHVEEDICRYWLDCSGEKILGQLASLEDLPSCPCFYSFSVHYNDQLWDDQHQRFFRWRDASGVHDQLVIYKPGARWCIRSLTPASAPTPAAQHCCYDADRRLITRGAGAGTPNFVSPEISREFHQQIDILPWILCKGDWTRYQIRRPPNNENNCHKNPDDEEYNKQKKDATEF